MHPSHMALLATVDPSRGRCAQLKHGLWVIYFRGSMLRHANACLGIKGIARQNQNAGGAQSQTFNIALCPP